MKFFKQHSRPLLLFIILLFTISSDQITKKIAFMTLRGHGSISFLNKFFILVYAENNGAFLSMGSNFTGILRTLSLYIIPVLMLAGGIILLVIFINKINNSLLIGFAFYIGGGISNIYDRLVNECGVIDFMNIGIGSLRSGIFNFADIFLIIGAVYLFVGLKKESVKIEMDEINKKVKDEYEEYFI